MNSENIGSFRRMAHQQVSEQQWVIAHQYTALALNSNTQANTANAKTLIL